MGTRTQARWVDEGLTRVCARACVCVCQRDVFTQHRLSLSCFPMCAFCSTPIPQFGFLSQMKTEAPHQGPVPEHHLLPTHTLPHTSEVFSLSKNESAIKHSIPKDHWPCLIIYIQVNFTVQFKYAIQVLYFVEK